MLLDRWRWLELAHCRIGSDALDVLSTKQVGPSMVWLRRQRRLHDPGQAAIAV